MRAARALVLEMDANRRQLGALAGRAAGSATLRTLLYLSLAVALSLPPLASAAFLIAYGTWGIALLGAIPVAFFLLVALAGLVALRRSFAKLELACAARPPRAPGEAARCHVCGGPLSANDGITRCAFCKSDNVITASLAQRVEDFDEEATADLSQAVRDRAEAVAGTWRRISLVLVGALVTGPTLTCLVTGCLAFAPQPELEPGASEPVTIVERDGARCLGQIVGDDERLWFRGRAESGYWAFEPHADRAAYEWVAPETLLGRRVRTLGNDTVEGRFDRVVGSLDSRNAAIFVLDDGEEARHAIAGLCLLD